MKNCYIIWMLAFLIFSEGLATGQSAQKSSGVVNLNMKKAEDVKKIPVEEPMQRNVSSTTFTPTITKKVESVSVPVNNSGDIESGVSWIAPTFNTINTSNGTYKIMAKVTCAEPLRVINIFLNDEFYGNEIVEGGPVQVANVDKDISLTLGTNVVRIEGIGISGARVVDNVYINYDISSARYYALIIAVEDYADPSINDLDQPIDDAKKFYDLLNKRYTFNEEDITFLQNPTKADIIGTLHSMRSVISEEDNLLIFYAGHGYWDEEMLTGYWLPSDAESDNPVNWLPNTDLTNYLNVLKSKHTLLIADACFSGGIFKTRSAFSNSGSIEKLYRLPSRKAITSGTLTEVPDNSVFLKYLISELRDNLDEYLTSEQLFSKIRVSVMNNSDNVPQYGTIQKVGDEGGDFVFILK